MTVAVAADRDHGKARSGGLESGISAHSAFRPLGAHIARNPASRQAGERGTLHPVIPLEQRNAMPDGAGAATQPSGWSVLGMLGAVPAVGVLLPARCLPEEAVTFRRRVMLVSGMYRITYGSRAALADRDRRPTGATDG